jgi:hypothetical protein
MMSKTYETGHAKNLANFNSLISFCEGYGSAYNPAALALQLSSLQTQAVDAQSAYEEAKKKQLAFNKVVDERMIAFAPLRSLSQRMLAALAASGCSSETLEGAKTINRKIQGRRKKNTAAGVSEPTDDPTEGNKPAKSISASQQSYDNLSASFSAFIELLVGQAEYQPNETELQTTSLSSYLDTLKVANKAVIDAYTLWSNTRINRNKVMYAKGTGMVDIAQLVKNYVKSVFGNGSPEYKQVSPLEIKKVPK